MSIKVDQHQIDLLHHTLGLRPDRREPHRNHFVAGPGHHDNSDLEYLVSLGLMEQAQTPKFMDDSDIVYRCTADGSSYAIDNLPMPPKRSRYQEYLDSEYGDSFADWLGITVPMIDYDRGRYRYYRYKNYEFIYGDWKLTKKEAKASYKEALKKAKTSHSGYSPRTFCES